MTCDEDIDGRLLPLISLMADFSAQHQSAMIIVVNWLGRVAGRLSAMIIVIEA
jgi:hypothetical protein